MKFSKMIFVLTIAASAIFICMMGSSYAYYTATATDISVTTGTINNGISVVFTDNNYVNVKTGVPLDDEQVMEYAKANTFSIMPDATILEGYDAYVNISLINVKIDDALKVSDFKYSLVCMDGNNSQSNLGSGDGTSITTGTNISIGDMSTTNNTFNINTNYQCYFRVWIANKADTSQNELMDKKFSALLKVNTIMRKQ
jgi:hypothetical protein